MIPATMRRLMAASGSRRYVLVRPCSSVIQTMCLPLLISSSKLMVRRISPANISSIQATSGAELKTTPISVFSEAERGSKLSEPI